VCADGGANRLYDELPAMLPGQSADAVRSAYLPTAIQGDLDSIRPDVLDFYRSRGVPVHDLSGERVDEQTPFAGCAGTAHGGGKQHQPF
jgi:thiamine pyrophosphokinase